MEDKERVRGRVNIEEIRTVRRSKVVEGFDGIKEFELNSGFD